MEPLSAPAAAVEQQHVPAGNEASTTTTTTTATASADGSAPPAAGVAAATELLPAAEHHQPPPPPPAATAATTTPPPSPKPKAPQAEVNYAAEKAGAVVLQSSEALVGAKNLLDDDKDKYARSPCDQGKWVIINLSEDIRVHALVLANYEKFSSTVKDFQVQYSVKCPSLDEDSEDWLDLGTFQAKEKSGEQRFPVDPPRYARYLKVKLLSHWSREFYCTLSQIKVFGSTLQQGFMDDWQRQKQNLGSRLEVIDPEEEGERGEGGKGGSVNRTVCLADGTCSSGGERKKEGGGEGEEGRKETVTVSVVPSTGSNGQGEGGGGGGAVAPGSEVSNANPAVQEGGAKEGTLPAAAAAGGGEVKAGGVEGTQQQQHQPPQEKEQPGDATHAQGKEEPAAATTTTTTTIPLASGTHQDTDKGTGATPPLPSVVEKEGEKVGQAAAAAGGGGGEKGAAPAQPPVVGGEEGKKQPAEQQPPSPPPPAQVGDMTEGFSSTPTAAAGDVKGEGQQQASSKVGGRGEEASKEGGAKGEVPSAAGPSQPAPVGGEAPPAAGGSTTTLPLAEEKQTQGQTETQTKPPATMDSASISSEKGEVGGSPPASPPQPNETTTTTTTSSTSTSPMTIEEGVATPIPRTLPKDSTTTTPPPPPPSGTAGSSTTPPPTTPGTTTTVVATVSGAAAKTELMSRFRHQCLQQMRLGDFKKQKLAKLQEDLRVKGGEAASSLGSGSPYDNIFKTLMDEMTSLEINQSIFDVYVSNLHSCFVQVVDDVLLEQDRARIEFVETMGLVQGRLQAMTAVNEQLLVRLNRVESNNFFGSVLGWVLVGLVVVLLVCTQAYYWRRLQKQTQQQQQQHYHQQGGRTHAAAEPQDQQHQPYQHQQQQHQDYYQQQPGKEKLW